MRIRGKTMLMVLTTFVFMIIAVFAVTDTILLRGFARLEEQQTQKNAERARDILFSKNRVLRNKIIDWGAWDDTYFFMNDMNRHYIEMNLSEDSFEGLGIDFVVFIDNEGRIVYSKGYDPESGKEGGAPANLLGYLANSALPLRNPRIREYFSGIIVLPEGPVMIAGYSIITSKYTGPPRGT
ncbi:MAG: CHASE4 domain-containing protein, partial [bacterium]